MEVTSGGIVIKSEPDRLQVDISKLPKGKIELFTKLENDFKLASEACRAQHVRWYWYLMLYQGSQWTTPDYKYNSVRRLPRPKGRVFHVANRIQAIVTKQLSKIIRLEPEYHVIPPTGDPNDRELCDAATMFIRAKRKQTYLKHQPKKTKHAFNVLVYGDSFILPYWDSGAGREIPALEYIQDPTTGEMTASIIYDKKSGQPVTISEGDFNYKVISPFYVYPNPECDTWHEINWTFMIAIKPIDDVKYIYRDVKGVEEIEGETTQQFKRINYIPDDKDSLSSKNTSDQIVVKTAYYRPCYQFPEGKKVVYVMNPPMILEESSLREIPLINCKYQENDGTIWSPSLVGHLAAPQQEYNKTRSQQLEIKNFNHKPKVIRQKGDGISDDSFTDEAGEIIICNPGRKPEYLMPPPTSSIFPQELETTARDMEEISYVHEVSKAQVPTGARSGVALNILQEQDDEFLAPLIKNFVETDRLLWNAMLEIIQANYSRYEDRTTYALGKHKQIEAIKFHAADLKSGWNIEVIGGESVPLTPAQRLNVLIQLATTGFIDPKVAIPRIDKLANLGFFDDTTPDERELNMMNIVDENMRLLKGEEVHVFFPDDHILHFEQHLKFMLSPEYRQSSAEVQKNFIRHNEAHRSYLMPEQPTPEEKLESEESEAEAIAAGIGVEGENNTVAKENG